MILDRTRVPPFKVPEKISLVHPQKRRLKNGIPLFFIPSPQIEAIKLEVIFPIHYHPSSLDQTLVPFFMLHMLQEGTHSKSSGQVDDFFDFHGSEIEVLSGYENQGLGILTTGKHLPDVLPVFRSLFTDAVFPDKELAKRKSQKKLSINIQKEQNSARANQLVRKILFGHDHPFGYNAQEEDIDKIEKDSLVHYYKNQFLVTPEIFVTGQLTENTLLEIERVFEDLTFINPFSQLNPIKPFAEQRITEIKGESVQSSIRLGKLMIPKAHPDYHGLVVFNTILGGYFGSRLIKNIREEKGYTYGINSFLGNLSSADYWIVMADVKAGFAEPVIDEVYLEINKLTKDLISDDELEIVRNYMIGHLLAQVSSPFDLMNQFKNIHYNGLNENFYQHHLDYIKNFQKEEISEIGMKYFQPGSFKEIIVGAK
ncbi:MAG: pitrilysin family protein [Cyclobacteriaceae bacterium]